MQYKSSAFYLLDHLAVTRYLLRRILRRCTSPHSLKNGNETQDTEEAPTLVVKRIREAILDEVFKPGDRLGEVKLGQ